MTNNQPLPVSYKLQYLENGRYKDVFLQEIDRYFSTSLNTVKAAKKAYLDVWPNAVVRIVKYSNVKHSTLTIFDNVEWTTIFNGKMAFFAGQVKKVYKPHPNELPAYLLRGKCIVTGVEVEEIVMSNDNTLEKTEVL